MAFILMYGKSRNDYRAVRLLNRFAICRSMYTSNEKLFLYRFLGNGIYKQKTMHLHSNVIILGSSGVVYYCTVSYLTYAVQYTCAFVQVLRGLLQVLQRQPSVAAFISISRRCSGRPCGGNFPTQVLKAVFSLQPWNLAVMNSSSCNEQFQLPSKLRNKLKITCCSSMHSQVWCRICVFISFLFCLSLCSRIYFINFISF